MHCRQEPRPAKRTEDTRTDIDGLPPPPAAVSAAAFDDVGATTVESSSAARKRLLAGRYAIERPLSGSRDVFVAKDLIVRRSVVVKVLRHNWSRATLLRDRFEQAALALAAIEHAGVVRVFDLLVDEPAVVMEHVRGVSLEQLVREGGPMQVQRALGIAIQICSALHAAHSVGLVHGTLSAAKVIVMRDDERRELAKLIGFELSPPIGEELGTFTNGPEVEWDSTQRRQGVRGDLCRAAHLLVLMLSGKTTRTGYVDLDALRERLERSVGRAAAAKTISIIEGALGRAPEKAFSSANELWRALRDLSCGLAATGEMRSTVRGGWRRIAPAHAVAIWLAAMLAVAFLGFYVARHSRAPRGSAVPGDAPSVEGGT